MESASGLGYIMGPLLGAAIYSVFKYFWTFIIFGLIMILLIPILYVKKKRSEK